MKPIAPSNNRLGRWFVRHGWPTWVFTLALWLMAVLAVFAQIFAGFVPEDGRPAWTVIAVAGTALSLLAEFSRRKRDAAVAAASDEYERGRLEQFRTAMRGALSPITIYAAEVAAAQESDRSEIAGRMSQAMVEALVKVTGSRPDKSQLRSAYYALSGTKGKRMLERRAFAGREGPEPREFFREGKRDGSRYLIQLVEKGNINRTPHVSVNTRVKPTHKGSYEDVIACAVAVPGQPMGLLSLDTPHVGDLTEDDKQLIRVLANLLGATLALVPHSNSAATTN